MPFRAYLDHNATTPMLPAAREAMIEALACVGNPSSIHAEGRAARMILEAARRQVAALTGSAPDDVVFTSGGTEALNMILSPEVTGPEGAAEVLLVGAGEHAAVWAGHRFAADQVATIATMANGVLDLAALAKALEEHAGRRVMLALQAANNETGVLQPVADAAALVHRHGGFVVCDAVQAAGKMDCILGAFDADALVVSAHKFGGPKGAGALIFAPSRHHLRRGLVRGGGQERGLRSGTENLAGIAGLGAAAAFAGTWRTRSDRLRAQRREVERIVSAAAGAVIFGAEAERLPNTVSFALQGFDAQSMLMNLDLAGIAVSTGSACSSGKVRPSHVLRAMAVPPEVAAGAVRVSLGWTTTDDDIAAFSAAFTKAVRMIRPKAGRIAA